MNYALRGFAVSFSIFFTLYVVLSLVVGVIWKRGWLYGQRDSAQVCCDRLFALRMAPFFLALVATFFFAIPSFLEFEPHIAGEPMERGLPLLALCGVAVFLIGTWNVIEALRQVSKTVARWSANAKELDAWSAELNSVPVIQTAAAAPPLAVAGILHSRVWMSNTTEFVLTEPELRCALRHELVHIRRRDNLRKLMLRFVALPGMAELENAWREASEMAADDAAVSSASEALDLAAAVIKLSRVAPIASQVELTTGLVHSPAASLDERVKRLIAWPERQQGPVSEGLWRSALCAAVIMVVILANYTFLLLRVHAATEWWVR
jgi:beta-lactamase regulating signal transducer with metallopeptidase domain